MTVRVAVALAVLVSAGVHLLLWQDGMREEDVVGPAFMLNAVGGAVIAVLLVVWRHWLPPLLALGFGLSTLGAFVVSTTVGLFGVESSWEGWEAWTAAAAEAWAMVGGSLLLAREHPMRSRRQREHDTPVGRPHLH